MSVRVLLGLLLMLAPSHVRGETKPVQTSEARGLAVARAAEAADTGYGDYRASLRMILRNREGDETIRDLRYFTMEADENRDFSIVTFDRPRDIRNTSLLTYSNVAEDDDQWLFLPALKRTKRVSTANRSGPFVGSEFAYEDMTAQQLTKYDYRYLREEICGPRRCDVIERIPKDANSGYSRQVAWISKDDHLYRRIEYYARNGSHLKTLSLWDYHRYMTRIWRAHRMSMVNHQTGKSTELEWEEFEFDSGLTEHDFNPASFQLTR